MEIPDTFGNEGTNTRRGAIC